MRPNPLIAATAGRANFALRSVDKPKMEIIGATWSVTLSRNSSILEMAAVMARFKCHAELLPNGDAKLWPFDRTAGWPTAQEIAELLQNGSLSGS